MRIYNIPINADLLEILMPINEKVLSADCYNEYCNLVHLLHSLIELEVEIKGSGALPSAVMDRAGHPYRIGELR